MGVVAQLRPGAVELGAAASTAQVDRAIAPAPVALNPPRRNTFWLTCTASASRAEPESLISSAPMHESWPPMQAPRMLTVPSSGPGHESIRCSVWALLCLRRAVKAGYLHHRTDAARGCTGLSDL